VKELFVVLVMVGVSMCGSSVNAQTAPAQENNPHVIRSQDLDLLRPAPRLRAVRAPLARGTGMIWTIGCKQNRS
jgi:hypothetical protein